MPQPNDLSRSLVALDHNSTIIAVIEMSRSSWLVGGMVPGIERQPRKSWPRRKRRWRSPTITEADPLTVMAEPECASLAKRGQEDQSPSSWPSPQFAAGDRRHGVTGPSSTRFPGDQQQG